MYGHLTCFGFSVYGTLPCVEKAIAPHHTELYNPCARRVTDLYSTFKTMLLRRLQPTEAGTCPASGPQRRCGLRGAGAINIEAEWGQRHEKAVNWFTASILTTVLTSILTTNLTKTANIAGSNVRDSPFKIDRLT